jgi:hypothetical protein
LRELQEEEAVPGLMAKKLEAKMRAAQEREDMVNQERRRKFIRFRIN